MITIYNIDDRENRRDNHE